MKTAGVVLLVTCLLWVSCFSGKEIVEMQEDSANNQSLYKHFLIFVISISWLVGLLSLKWLMNNILPQDSLYLSYGLE